MVGLPLLGFAILFSAIGDCVPDAPCDHHVRWEIIGAVVAIAALVGIGSRALINWIVRRGRSDS
jgi:hypothetical protein